MADAGVEVERNLLIPMSDGVSLAGDLFRPAGAGRFPSILTFIPYHKDGRGGRLDIEAFNRHFVALGYAALTVDFRGLGNSGGTSPEPFDPQEAKDGHEVVEWIARQPWCDGKVGMWGVSYGGITSLSVAATQPPHLAAIVPIHATADIHRGFVAPGGCRGGFWNEADWGPRMVAYNLMPPLWQDGEGRWAEIWRQHLEANGPWLLDWWEHSGRDSYWTRRVVPVERIRAACFNIGGWRDLYADCTVIDFAAIKAPKRLLMGPWKHAFPDKALEAPVAGLHEIERWFERWLKGVDNGVDKEPPVVIHVQGAEGEWRAESTWPIARVRHVAWFLGPDGSLAAKAPAGANAPSQYAHDATVGLQSIVWDPWSTSLDPALPRDQSGDDARSLTFTGPSLTEPLELVGGPVAVLDVAASAAPLTVVAKLADVAANGRSTLITTGWLDLALREGAERALPVAAGERYAVRVPMRATAYRLPAGHRLRLSLACADFPRIWPTPKQATLSVFHGASHVQLPVAPAQAPSLPAPRWGKLQAEALSGPHDLGSDTATLTATKEEHQRLDGFTKLHTHHGYEAKVSAANPQAARMSASTRVEVDRPVTRTTLNSSVVATTYDVSIKVEIDVDGLPYWSRSWSRRRGKAPAR